MGCALVKRFAVPAPSQELILQAFQEDNWPATILNPLSAGREATAAERLHNAIRGLNRNQVRSLIRFHANGNGDGVVWALIDEGNSSPPTHS